jgi:glycosyltransferase involved in cell wall biosynthesis
MVRYTVAVCNYNMAETVGDSLRSILDQTDDRFEVVCVDGGSTDGSQSVLEELTEEYDRLRIDLQDPDPDRHLGADRNRSFELADGEYVLESFDCDNVYYNIVEDLVEVYHQLEDGIDHEFLLSAMGVNMAPRSLVLRIPYHNLGGAEDRDWFRWLAAEDAIIWLERTGPIKEQVGYDKGPRKQIERDINGKICDFQSGITLTSALTWSLHHERHFIYERDRGPLLNNLKKPYDLFSHCYAYWKARGRQRHAAPPDYRQKGALERHVARERATLNELADQLGIEIDANRLSETGRQVYLPE